MSSYSNQLLSSNEHQRRNASIICMVFLSAFLLLAVLFIYLALQTRALQLYALTGLMLIVSTVSVISLRLVRKENISLGIGLVVSTIIIILPLTSLLIQGLGIYFGIAQLTGITLIIALTMARRSGIVLGILNIFSAGLTLYLDLAGDPNRLSSPIVEAAVALIVVLGVFFFFVILIREFRNFGLQAKISLGILFTGGIALGILSFFALNSIANIIAILSDRLETNVTLLAEEQLSNTVSNEANRANQSFDATTAQVVSLASQIELLQEQKNTLGDGAYWDANERITQLDQGQYSNSRYDPSSVFIPSTTVMDEAMVRELNVTVYMDFSAPFVLENNEQIDAVYYTDPEGVIVYYPNIQLASILSHDYDGADQPTFRVATPLYNLDKVPTWSFPRQDPAGKGLIVSLSAPVYFKDEFKGVTTADFQLQQIADDINSIKIGETGYAFLVDKDGHIIAMPPEGYEFFGLEPEVLEMNQEPQQTIFDGRESFELQQITNRMVVGGSGIITTNVDGVDTFIAYEPLANNSFSLGVIVPVEELTQPVAATRAEISTQIQLALRNASIILMMLLTGALFVSLGLGRLIAAPVLRLTQTANSILEGDLAARADITSRDEIGTLANAFNAMTSRLRETLLGLEKIVDERTSELLVVSESNERRAKQFQSIAQVARTISSTLEFDSLLMQITTVISSEFNFYHVGVFLLDVSKEYAVLSAANSDGGQVMLVRGHRLKVGEKGLVGFVSSTGKPRVALDTGADAVFFNNPDLPNTRSEVALPLLAGQEVIGVLDVQSKVANAFSEEDVAILSTLADQVSIAIQNARQNDETKRALAESESLSRQFIQAGWSDFTKKENLLGVRHSGAKTSLIYTRSAKGKDDTLKIAGQLKPRGRGAVLSLPIKLRGEVIGSVDVRAPDSRQWDQDEMDIITAIIERAAIAMENARLLAESQRRAAKERTIGQISARISARTDVDELLKIAAQELNRTLPGSEIAIQLRKEENK